MSKKNKSTGKMTDERTGITAIIPLLFIIAITPLIVFEKATKLNSIESIYLSSTKSETDLFSYHKMVFFLVFALISLLPLLFSSGTSLFDKDRKKYYLPLGGYALLILVSSLASQYKEIAFFGFWGRYEGAIILLAYVGVLMAAMNLLKDEKQIKLLFTGLFASTAVIASIGALQLFGIDYFKSDVIQALITHSSLNDGGHIETSFGSRTLFSTLYNPNYVGSYMVMLVPALIVFLLYCEKLWQKLTLAALLVLAILNLIGCESRAGICGGVISLLILLFMFRKWVIRYKAVAISIVIVLFGGLVLINIITQGAVVNRITTLVIAQENNTVTRAEVLDNSLKGLSDIKISSEKVCLLTEKGTLQFKMIDHNMKVFDEKNARISTKVSGTTIYFTDKRFSNIRLETKPDEGSIEVFYNNYDLINVLFTHEGFMSGSNRWMTLRGEKDIEAFGFKNVETLGSSRGYIWSRTLPLLKGSILFGYGPDTYPIYFPQYDYIGKLKSYGTGNIFVDKPHNMYLQIAVNSGIVSLIFLLVLFGIYFVSSLKIYSREKFDSYLPFAGLACFAAFCGYAATGFFNDSTISVAPVFWIIFGLGIGINIRLERKQNLPMTCKNAVHANHGEKGSKQKVLY